MVKELLQGMERTDEDSLEPREDPEEITEFKPIYYTIIIYAGIGLIVGLLMLAAYNKGYGDGYTYVEEFKDGHIKKYCTCYDESVTRTPVLDPNWNPYNLEGP